MASSPQRDISAKDTKGFRYRVIFIGCIFFAAYAAIIGRAFQLQVLESDDLKSKARVQYDRRAEIPGQRGRILDRAGRELAASVDVDSIAIDPTLLMSKDEISREEEHRKQRAKEQGKAYRAPKGNIVYDREEATRRLAKVMQISESKMRAMLDTKKRFVWLKRQATAQETAAFRATGVAGLSIQKVSKRFYPQGELAAHVLGYANTDGQGIEGLEHTFDDVLKGRKDYVSILRDRRGRTAMMGGAVDAEALTGATLTLTIDSTIQHLAEKAVADAVEKFQALSGVAIVLDPKTGEILAMANVPTFNPNIPNQFPMAARRNRAVADQLEQGSTLKPLTVAAALEEGVVTPETSFDGEKGAMRVGRYIVHDSHPHDSMTVTEIIKYSSNIGVTKIAQKMGREKFRAYQRAFGYGVKPGTELPGETQGMLGSLKAEISLANQSFGQGINASILQTALAYGALANGGVMMKPHLVSKIVDSEGRLLLEQKPQVERRIVSEKTARAVIAMMEEVVKPGGTGTAAYMVDYPVAAKSGTAQKAENGVYTKKRTASFAGIVPSDAPRLVIAITIDEPTVNVYGGVVAAPPFKEIARSSLIHLGVPPRALPSEEKTDASKEKLGSGRSDRVASASRARLAGAFSMALSGDFEGDEANEAVVEGNGVVEAASNDDSGDVVRGNRPGPHAVRVPSLYGLTARKAARVLLDAGLSPKMTGYGLVVEQKPLAGQLVRRDGQVELTLK